MKDKMLALVEYLNARTAEYDAGHPTISDKDWDDKYFELIKLEKECGYVLDNSPTSIIDYRIVTKLNKVEHNHKMLSLDKTQDINEVLSFFGDNGYVAMAKMDGLTCSLRYVNGVLVGAETRGNGFVGDDILHNAKVIPSIPNTINYKDELIVDGEIICTYQDFDSFSSDYKNPRNFAAGSIRLLDSKECASRKLTFVAWDVIEGFNDEKFLTAKLKKVRDLGFIIVPYFNHSTDVPIPIEEVVNLTVESAKESGYPIDGLVFKYNHIEYGKSMGETAHHFKNAIAYKFYDETYETELLDIEWSIGRTGILTPIAIFKTIDIDGSEVSRASLHNISVMEETLGSISHKFQKVEVMKAKMIIPQIVSANREKHEESFYLEYPAFEIPNKCPVCGGNTTVSENDGVKFLYCNNPSCEGKLINKLEHFCGKKGLDIKGFSKATIEKLIDWGWLSNRADIYNLHNYRNEWLKKPGFGEKSVDNILSAIENSKNCELAPFISSLGIPLIGSTVSRELVKYFNTWNDFREAINSKYSFWKIDGFGIEMHNAISNFDYTEADYIVNNYLHIKEKNNEDNLNNNIFENKNFVITGKLNNFKNRDELKMLIESLGGKVVGSISSKTSYLINNDINSSSSKNVSAKKIGIPIITEKDFLNLIQK